MALYEPPQKDVTVRTNKKGAPVDGHAFAKLLAERTGLEPATPGVTGRYSNQLNYRSAATKAYARWRNDEMWWVLQDLNL